MSVPMPDPRIAAVPLRESPEPLVDVAAAAPLRVAGRVRLRFGVVERLVVAQSLLPRDTRLVLVAGHRAGDPAHAGGGAVDLTVARAGDPPSAAARCGAAVLPGPAGLELLAGALTTAGLVADPSCWWHWSYGDRFWAFTTRAAYARYGPLP